MALRPARATRRPSCAPRHRHASRTTPARPAPSTGDAHRLQQFQRARTACPASAARRTPPASMASIAACWKLNVCGPTMTGTAAAQASIRFCRPRREAAGDDRHIAGRVVESHFAQAVAQQHRRVRTRRYVLGTPDKAARPRPAGPPLRRSAADAGNQQEQGRARQGRALDRVDETRILAFARAGHGHDRPAQRRAPLASGVHARRRQRQVEFRCLSPPPGRLPAAAAASCGVCASTRSRPASASRITAPMRRAWRSDDSE